MAVGVKRKRTGETVDATIFLPQKIAKPISNNVALKESTSVPEDMEPQLRRITESDRTPFEKKVWSLLCQIPRGHVSTYALLAAHLGSSPRAVGNALRRNPFAPEVPCHRVVATGGALGGFKGKWPKDGEGITLDEKRKLLRGEGIKLDDKGKVLGTPWAAFN
ncbi:Methylated-DNA-protein-cysteine methyltransferase [Daldinia childiae]|uniref:Methylated-DNA-protein-cysteine methyltransferase n=1 Tax=Daldinia childiae TaxID=326645 RepID=UPI001446A4A1|nr:Methylated-DNA-protein-cysteine methyltransferase [Daldinia childiae]KAF3071309.1 Methylated-DNA-protein-cysteine methyltransferase [Daldinia childiae]